MHFKKLFSLGKRPKYLVLIILLQWTDSIAQYNHDIFSMFLLKCLT